MAAGIPRCARIRVPDAGRTRVAGRRRAVRSRPARWRRFPASSCERLACMTASRDPIADLREIAFLLERNLESTYRVRAYRTAADTLDELGTDEVARRASDGTLTELKGVGAKTAAAVVDSLHGERPEALTRLLRSEERRVGKECRCRWSP